MNDHKPLETSFSLFDAENEGSWVKETTEKPQTTKVIRSQIPCAKWGSLDHPIHIGDVEIPCFVLEDGRRVLIQASMIKALDMSQGTASGKGGGDRLTRFIGSRSISPYVPESLKPDIFEPIRFRTTSGATAYGYEASVLATLCETVIEAQKKGKLNYQQTHIAKRCKVLLEGFTRVGIIALVDEATGYQKVRRTDDLQKILEAYVNKEFLPWTRKFPDPFYEQLFRLKEIPYDPKSLKRPKYFGMITEDIVYRRLPPGVLEKLREVNPKNEKGNRPRKYHQHLKDIGQAHLRDHLLSVTTLMRASVNWVNFRRNLERAFPKSTTQIEFEELGFKVDEG